MQSFLLCLCATFVGKDPFHRVPDWAGKVAWGP
jgi:hypothetical protein